MYRQLVGTKRLEIYRIVFAYTRTQGLYKHKYVTFMYLHIA